MGNDYLITCVQPMDRQACVSAQFDQRICYQISIKHNTLTYYILKIVDQQAGRQGSRGNANIKRKEFCPIFGNAYTNLIVRRKKSEKLTSTGIL